MASYAADHIELVTFVTSGASSHEGRALTLLGGIVWHRAQSKASLATMSVSAPPIQSPDGQWWWDGVAWQPIANLPVTPRAAASPVAAEAAATPAATETDWPAWLPRSSSAEAVVAGVQTRANPRAASVQAVSPLAPVVIPGEASSSTWAQQQYQVTAAPGRKNPPYALIGGLGVLGLVAAVVTYMVPSQTGYLTVRSTSGPVAASPTPSGSPYEQAERFLNGPFDTAINQLVAAQAPMIASCNGSGDLTQACTDAITGSDTATKNAIAVIDRGPVPACITAGVQKIRADLDNMEHGLAQAHLGHDLQTVGAGLAIYGLAGQPLAADAKELQATETSACAKPPIAVTSTAAAAAPTAYPAAVPAGWLVYRNPTWKYSVAYPPSWFQPPAANGDGYHYFSNENVSQHGVMSAAGFDLDVVSRQACLTTGGENNQFEPVISSAKVQVAGQTVTRYFDQFKPGPVSAGGWNIIADVQVGANCIQFASFSYSRSVSEALLPSFDAMLASVRPA